MNATLNEIEQRVYDALVSNARSYGENGGCCYEEIDYQSMGLTLGQVKGYLSQLCQKGYIEQVKGCYYSHVIINDR